MHDYHLRREVPLAPDTTAACDEKQPRVNFTLYGIGYLISAASAPSLPSSVLPNVHRGGILGKCLELHFVSLTEFDVCCTLELVL